MFLTLLFYFFFLAFVPCVCGGCQTHRLSTAATFLATGFFLEMLCLKSTEESLGGPLAEQFLFTRVVRGGSQIFGPRPSSRSPPASCSSQRETGLSQGHAPSNRSPFHDGKAQGRYLPTLASAPAPRSTRRRATPRPPSPPVPPHDWPQASASSRPQPASRPSLLGRPVRPEGATKPRNIEPCRSRAFSRCVCDEWRRALMGARRMRALGPSRLLRT